MRGGVDCRTKSLESSFTDNPTSRPLVGNYSNIHKYGVDTLRAGEVFHGRIRVTSKIDGAAISLVREIDRTPVARRYDASSADGPHSPAMGLLADAKRNFHTNEGFTATGGNDQNPAC